MTTLSISHVSDAQRRNLFGCVSAESQKEFDDLIIKSSVLNQMIKSMYLTYKTHCQGNYSQIPAECTIIEAFGHDFPFNSTKIQFGEMLDFLEEAFKNADRPIHAERAALKALAQDMVSCKRVYVPFFRNGSPGNFQTAQDYYNTATLPSSKNASIAWQRLAMMHDVAYVVHYGLVSATACIIPFSANAKLLADFANETCGGITAVEFSDDTDAYIVFIGTVEYSLNDKLILDDSERVIMVLPSTDSFASPACSAITNMLYKVSTPHVATIDEFVDAIVNYDTTGRASTSPLEIMIETNALITGAMNDRVVMSKLNPKIFAGLIMMPVISSMIEKASSTTLHSTIFEFAAAYSLMIASQSWAFADNRLHNVSPGKLIELSEALAAGYDEYLNKYDADDLVQRRLLAMAESIPDDDLLLALAMALFKKG